MAFDEPVLHIEVEGIVPPASSARRPRSSLHRRRSTLPSSRGGGVPAGSARWSGMTAAAKNGSAAEQRRVDRTAEAERLRQGATGDVAALGRRPKAARSPCAQAGHRDRENRRSQSRRPASCSAAPSSGVDQTCGRDGGTRLLRGRAGPAPRSVSPKRQQDATAKAFAQWPDWPAAPRDRAPSRGNRAKRVGFVIGKPAAPNTAR